MDRLVQLGQLRQDVLEMLKHIDKLIADGLALTVPISLEESAPAV